MVTTTTGRATDFITFSRTSNATVTDSNGLIKWAGHNLLTNSESFDASAWNKANTTVTANNIVAPNGTTTADRIVEQAVTDRHFVNQNDRISASNTLFPHTLAVFAKAGERQYINLSIEWSTNYVAATFDLSGGTVTSNRAGGTGTGNTSTITAVGGGWYLCTLTGILGTAGSNGAVIAITDTATPTGASGGTYLGDATKGLYIWGAHLYRSDLGSMVLNPARGDAYYPTTPRNLLGFTEDFSNAAWTKSGLAATPVLTNVLNGPNGLLTADKMVENSSASTHILFATVTVADGPKTFSVYAKAAERSWVFLRAGANIGAYFNLSAGSVGTADAGVTASIVSAGDGWYRCAITLNIAAGLTYPTIFISTGNGTTSYTGDGTSGIYLWGAQLSDSASLDAYSPVYGAAVTSAAYYAPRLDYSGSSLAALGLLVEEQRTNLLTYSSEFDNAAWGKVNATVTANTAVSPDGTTTADTVAVGVTAGGYVRSADPTVAISTVVTYSVFVKNIDATTSTILARVASNSLSVALNWSGATLSSVTVTTGTSATFTALANGWYRVSCVCTLLEANTPLRIYPGGGTDTNKSIYLYGAQLEVGSFATSYIPTGASTATRTADVASVSTQAFPYSSTAGSYVANFQTLFSGTQTLVTTILTVDGSGSKLIAYITGGAQNPATFDGSTIVSVANDVTGSISKIGSSFDASGRSFCANGSTVATGTVAAGYGSGSAVNIGGTLGTGYINGWFRQLTYIPRRLSSSELQARTV